ncbi:MAG: type II toxin-antitoxin system VapC family toxin [Casimicrobium sp.]
MLIDTNVISEPLRVSPDPKVVAWIDAQNVETLFLAAISLAELRFAITALPEGRRRDVLHENIERRVVPLFRGRILPFDADATAAYATLRARARANGQGIGVADGYIAATAAANGLSIATRDAAPFVAAGLNVINPWESLR